jgi:DNA-3-methyladenine glycosylase I
MAVWLKIDVRQSSVFFQQSDAPGKSKESEAMSRALKKLGFKFVGPTTCYSMMQSEGMVIDHPVDSDEWKSALKRLQERPGGFQESRGQK